MMKLLKLYAYYSPLSFIIFVISAMFTTYIIGEKYFNNGDKEIKMEMSYRKFQRITKVTDKTFDDIDSICKGQLKRVIIEKMPDGGIESEVRCFNPEKKKHGSKIPK